MKVTVTDEMRGKYAEDGSIAEWPAVSVLGRPYERKDATKQRLDSTTFVVVPPGRAEDVEIEHPAGVIAALPTRVSPSGVVTVDDSSVPAEQPSETPKRRRGEGA